MFVPPTRYFEVPKPTDAGWGQPVINKIKPELEANEAKKKAFGVELAKQPNNAFEAACIVCGEDTASAVYISINWLYDPIVIASRDLYLKTIELDTPLLDKHQFAARLLQISEEKDDLSGKYTIDAKDRIAVLNLYAKVQGFIDNPDDEKSSKTFVYNSMEVTFVEPTKKSVTVIEPIVETQDSNIVPLKLKLVG